MASMILKSASVATGPITLLTIVWSRMKNLHGHLTLSIWLID